MEETRRKTSQLLACDLWEAVETSKQLSELSPELQAKINWVVARQDRAWYNVATAQKELQAHKVPADEMLALDADPSVPNPSLSEADRQLLRLAKNLASSPIVLTDKEVAEAVQATSAKAVTQAIHYTALRAMLNRITEAAQLSTTN